MGSFLVLAKNKDYNYWILTDLNYKVNTRSSKNNIILSDSAFFTPYGIYDIIWKDQTLIATKKVSGKGSNYGFRHPKGKFDEIGARKRAYNTSSAQLLATAMNIGQISNTSISGGNKVAIYTKKKKPQQLKRTNIRGYLNPPRKKY